MKKTAFIILFVLLCFGAAQLIRPDFDSVLNPSQAAGTKILSGVPDSIEAIFRNSCYNCHTYQTQLSWYDKITPGNFMVVGDIERARAAVDLSRFDSMSQTAQNGTLYYALNKVLVGEMPLPEYKFVHPGAKLSEHEIQMLETYLMSRTPRKIADSIQVAASAKQYAEMLLQNQGDSNATPPPAPNGVPYSQGFRNWKAISTTDRFDNGTMRVIYGNDVAVSAIRSGHTNPWPDKTIFAKTTWMEELGRDGIVRTGKFIQVEFMIKDAKKYAYSKGWGWGRWIGDDLKPYGTYKQFEQECITCHKPVKDFDFVFTKPLALGLSK